METKHTPGPWVKDGLNWIGANGNKVVVSDGPAFGSRARFKEAEANARLISAAPELLEALVAITNQLERIGDTRPNKDGQFIDDARAAIAKATGQS